MEIYLVINTEDVVEPFVIDICSSYEVAMKKIDIYKKNFKENTNKKDIDFIECEVVTIDPEVDVLWTAYPYDS